jgi:tetratricopeptide (TPR) repeat protein
LPDIDPSPRHGSTATDLAPFAAAVELHPESSEAHLSYAQALIEHGKLAEALEAFGQAIQLAPQSIAALVGRGDLLSRMKAFDMALADQRRALDLSPTDIALHFAAIETLQARGDYAEAERSCLVVLEMDPASARGWERLGVILQTVGRFDEAAACFRRSLELQPSGIVSLKLAKMTRQTEAGDFARLTSLLQQPALSERDRVAAGFALGDLLDESEQYDEAFDAYAKANASFKDLSAREGFCFDGDDLRNIVDELIQTFTAEYFEKRSDFGQRSELPVFIVGMPRSGTSLVEQIAASHSKVFGAGELLEIPIVRARMAETVQMDSPQHWQRHWHRHLAKVHLAKLAMLGGSAERVTDKLPVNILNLGLIATMFPQARIILCERDPLDTALSCYFQLFDKHNLMFSYDLLDCAAQYNQQQRLTAHWKRVSPLRMLSVQYEQLVSEPEPQTRRLVEFLGLDWEPACLNFHNTHRPVLTKSVWQVRQPVYTRSIRRWKHYEAHLGLLRAALTSVE